MRFLLDNLPEPVTTVEGDNKTVVSYKVEDGKIKKVSCVEEINSIGYVVLPI